MKHLLTATLLLGAVTLAHAQTSSPANTPTTEANTATPTEKVLAVVNGQNITETAFQNALAPIKEKTPEIQKAVLNELINNQILLQEAKKLQIDQQASFKAQVQQFSDNLMVRTLLQDWINKNSVSEADLKKTYDNLAAELAKQTEYHVRHILVKTKPEADKIISRLKSKKARFADVAKKSSLDEPTAKNGGDLGWSLTSRYLPEFAQAIEATDKATLITTPVKSSIGYHVIEVLGTRPQQAAPFENVKQQLLERMSMEKISQYINELRQKSTIELK